MASPAHPQHAALHTQTGADPIAQDEVHLHDSEQLEVETDPNKFDSLLRLLEACRCASEIAIRRELHAGADPNKCLRIGTASTSPLPLQLVAGSHGDARAASCCSILLQFGARVTAAALRAADRAGNVATRRRLDRVPIKVDSTPPPKPTSSMEKPSKNTDRPKVGWVALGRTLGRNLFRALKNEHLSKADLALRQIEDRSLHDVARMAAVSWYDGCRYTPLHAAAVVGAADSVQRLLALGASPSWKTAHGADVLSVACSAQQVRIVALLKKRAADASPVSSTTMQTPCEPKVDSCKQDVHASPCHAADTEHFVLPAESSETDSPGPPQVDSIEREPKLTPHVSPTPIQLPPPLLESCSSVTKESTPATFESLVGQMSEGLPTFESGASGYNDLSTIEAEMCSSSRCGDEPPPTIQSPESVPNQESPLPTFESLASLPTELYVPIDEDNAAVASSQPVSPCESATAIPSTREHTARLARSSQGVAADTCGFESTPTPSKRGCVSNLRRLHTYATRNVPTRKSSSSRSTRTKGLITRRPRHSVSPKKWNDGNGKNLTVSTASVQASAQKTPTCKGSVSNLNGHLLRACGQRNVKLINALLTQGASATCKRISDGFSPLHIILAPRPVAHRQVPSSSGCQDENQQKVMLQCAKAILDADSAAATSLDLHGYPALFLAVKSGSLLLTELVLDAKPVVAAHSATTTGTTAMHIAAAAGFAHLIAPLARAGARLDAHMVNGRTPLAAASRLGHLKFVQALLAMGVSVQQECGAESALKLALEKRHSNVAAVLLEAGVPVTHRVIVLAQLSGSAAVTGKLHSRIQSERESRLQQAELLRIEAAKEMRAASLSITSAN